MSYFPCQLATIEVEANHWGNMALPAPASTEESKAKPFFLNTFPIRAFSFQYFRNLPLYFEYFRKEGGGGGAD
jgi:hypothetical protein